jgi:hypothetical protein
MRRIQSIINQATYNEIEAVLAPSACSAPTISIPAAQPESVCQQVNAGMQMATEEVSGWQVSILLGCHALACLAVHYNYMEHSVQQVSALPRQENDNSHKMSTT